IRHPIERVIVDQYRAQHALFGLDIVRCAPIGRSSRVGSELENVRIKWSHGQDWFFGFCRMRGAIERHSPAERKQQRALCPIHTMQCVNPDQAAHWRLTDIGCCRASHGGQRKEIWAWAEPYSRAGLLNPWAANVPGRRL